MSKEQQKPTQIQIQIDEKVADGEYANWANIVFSPAEFVLDFGRMMPGKPSVRVVSRVIITPQHAKHLLEALKHSTQQYETQHGEIKIKEDSQKKVGF